MENKDKYKAQIKHLRQNYKKFHIDFKIDLFSEFDSLCRRNNTTPTTEIKKFVIDYIKKYSVDN